jgi:hypothetical protein
VPERKQNVAAGKVLGHRPRHLGIDIAVLQVCDWSVEVTAQRLRQAVLAKGALADQDRAKRGRGCLLGRERARQLGLGDQTLGQKDVSKPPVRPPLSHGRGIVELEHVLMLAVRDSLSNGELPERVGRLSQSFRA